MVETVDTADLKSAAYSVQVQVLLRAPARVAQLVEQSAHNGLVTGSNPVLSTKV
jgi:hypothetical protein